MPLSDYQQLVDDMVRDRDQVVSTVQRDAAIAAAVAQYSVDHPRTVVVDVVSTGGQRQALPAGFTDDSRLVAIEYPIGNIPTTEIPLADVSIYAAPTERLLQLPDDVPVGESLRVSYTADQLLDDADDTVPARHRKALASLAASMLCTQLSAYYASEGESSIAADSVDFKDKSQRFRLLARDLAATYQSVVGSAPSDRNKPASVTVTPPRRNALGERRLFHPTSNWPRT
ncbi:MAG: hypothetical protein AB1832_01185 [Pseudomonadota bacterium]